MKKEAMMLEELSIRNYALIDSITLSFRDGFNVLTGETGAGKSIIVGSLSFLMGGKVEVDVIRSGCDEAGVSSVIAINKNNLQVIEWLKSRDIEYEEDTVIVRRNIKSTGRGSAYIQNIPVTRQDLTEFMGMLFDLHGQHNHESLLHRENHRIFLDRFAGIEDEVLNFHRNFLELTEKRKTLDASLKSDREREEKLDLLKFAVDEISKAEIRPGEIRELENEAQKLSDFEKLAGFVQTASSCFIEGEQSVLSLARRAKIAMDNACGVDSTLTQIYNRLENMYYEAEDIAGDFRVYRDGLTFNPQRLEEINERLSVLYKLIKKYIKHAVHSHKGSSSDIQTVSDEEAVISYKNQAEAEITALCGAEENREKLKNEIAFIEKDIVAKAQMLRQKRSLASEKLGELITGILSHLGMPNASFKVKIIPKETEGKISLGAWGSEEVEFLISANKGEPLKELAKIASGGELSRVMLSIKTALLSDSVNNVGNDVNDSILPSNDSSAETLVFDEIDTGIGGEVALKVGEYLSQIGKLKQIFCVTHLASIAVRADNHFKVEKKTEGGRTYTGIGPLSVEGRKKEIARMLAGDAGDAAIAHAQELIRKYGKRSG